MENLGEYLLIEAAIQKRGTGPGLLSRMLCRGENPPKLAGTRISSPRGGDYVSPGASGEVRSP